VDIGWWVDGGILDGGLADDRCRDGTLDGGMMDEIKVRIIILN
jgi:hypothetical protein